MRQNVYSKKNLDKMAKDLAASKNVKLIGWGILLNDGQTVLVVEGLRSGQIVEAQVIL